MRILQINTADLGGGAARVAWDLFRAYRLKGHASWLAVGEKRSDDPDTFEIPCRHRPPPGWGLIERRLLTGLPASAREGARRLAVAIARPGRALDWWLGREQFRFPGTHRVLDLVPARPDIVHAHNLHGNYFDLRALPWLSRQAPLVLTLHDGWLLSGHCAHSFDCDRWQSGCGRCPDLTIYPALRRDGTAGNWRRKEAIYRASSMYVAAPCRWLLERVERSMLAEFIEEARIIPHGVDLSIFRPGDQAAARAALGMPADGAVLLCAGNRLRKNRWKDFETVRIAAARIARERPGRRTLLLGLGDRATAERAGALELSLIPFNTDPVQVARYYQAADVYLHAARVDTFPNAVLEALACGTPVVATATGGIVEQVRSLRLGSGGPATAGHEEHDAAAATGVLVPRQDPEAMAAAVLHLLGDQVLRARIGENAAQDARRRFDLARQADVYLEWYASILTRPAVS